MSQNFYFLILLFLSILGISHTGIYAQTQVLDYSFGQNGIKKVNLAKGKSGNTMAVQFANGDYVSAGAFGINNYYFKGLTKYKSNGQVDSTFGIDGVAFSATDTLSGTSNIPVYCIKDTNENILVGANTQLSLSMYVIRIHRYLINGILDTSFANNGIFQYQMGSTSAQIENMYLLKDNSFLLAGRGGPSYAAFILKVDATGKVDSSFGVNGLAQFITPFSGYVSDIYQTHDHKIYTCVVGTGDSKIVRFKENGFLDSTYAIIGSTVAYDFWINSMIEQDDKSMIFAGTNPITSKCTVIKLDSIGNYINTFGLNGKCKTNFIFRPATVVALFSGNLILNDVLSFDFLKITAAGKVDTTFGTLGLKSLLTYPISQTRKIFIDSNNKIVFGGLLTLPSAFTTSKCIGRVDTAINFDNTFSSIGYNYTEVGKFDNPFNSLGVTSDGKVVFAAIHYDITGPLNIFSSYGKQAQLFKLQHDGNLDPTFGTNSTVIDKAVSGDLGYMLVDKNDKIILASRSLDTIMLSRYTVSGGIDNSFANAGYAKVVPSFKIANSNYLQTIAIDANENIYRSFDTSGNWKPVVFRYTPNGSADITFGTNGLARPYPRLGNKKFYTQEVKVQADNKPITVGFVDSAGTQKPFVARFNTNGSGDSSFNNYGYNIFKNVPDSCVAWRAAIAPDGKIVLAGGTMRGGSEHKDARAIRLNIDGSIDNTFGTNGLATFDILGNSKDMAFAVQVLSNNQVLLMGDVRLSNNTQHQFVIRLQENGTVDSTFGNNGIFVYSLGGNQSAYCYNSALVNNSLFVGGSYFDEDNVIYSFISKILLQNALGVIDNKEEDHTLLLYPNPIQSQAIFEYQLSKDEMVSAQILDVQGRVAQQLYQNKPVAKGDNRLAFTLNNNLSNGQYFLILSTQTAKRVITFIKN